MAPRNTRSERIEARTTPEVLAIVRRAADMQGRTLSDFVMSAAEEAANRTIAESQIVRLSADDQKRFVEALLDPPSPAAAMVRAFDHHRRLTGDA